MTRRDHRRDTQRPPTCRTSAGGMILLCSILAGGVPISASTLAAARNVEEFLMERNEEVTLARSAAPSRIGADAAVLVLTPDGFEEAESGSNGFVCLVERSWTGPGALTASDDFYWNPRVRAPICYNAAAGGSVLPKQLLKAELALAGTPREEIAERIAAGLDSGEIPTPPPSAMAYMLSAGQYLGDRAKRGIPHLMLYIPHAISSQWGGFDPGSPQAFILQDEGGPEAVVIVPAARFVELSEVAG